ncbi:ECF RNA polymerase sigma factor SigF [Pararobbsia alpina]|uniref:sigma-70 family RNA polymerase sigma factor n=1 Tax=Pararobbsia alpina TaxID=621374 RepID=UPI0039A608BE
MPPSRNRRIDTSRTEEAFKDLLLRALDGDARAYERFLDGVSGYLRGTLRRRLRSCESDIEDVLQEILIALHKGLHTYRQQVPLTAWIAAIARHKIADHYRGHALRDALHEPFDDENTDLFVASEAESVEASRDIERLLKTLPEKQSAPIVMVKLNGMSVAETAKATGLSESAVKVGIHRGIKALTRMIRGQSD